jgi:hypothetical protein
VQTATPVSAVTPAIDRAIRRMVVLVTRLSPLRSVVLRTLAQGTDTRMSKQDEPRTSKGCGARCRNAYATGCRDERTAQTAAGSSSTRRLRVRFESIGMPGPIVVLMAAFLM